MLISQRAWIAPYEVKVEGDFSSGGKSRFVVDYRNVGGQPATKVRHVGGFASIAEGEQHAWPNFCQDASENSDLVITAYPSESVHYTMGINWTEMGSVYEVLSGEKILYLKGCFVYETFGEPHQSQFCFRWVRDPVKPFKDWRHQFCSTGNDGN